MVTPLLLASAYHARVDIPAMIDEAGADVLQADTLGEDPRLVEVMRERLAEADVSEHDRDLGVLVVAVGASRAEANARTATLAEALAAGTRWAGVQVALCHRPAAVGDGRYRAVASHAARAGWCWRRGSSRRDASPTAWPKSPRTAGVSMAEPLGAHPLMAATVLDRFDRAVAQRAAA